MTQSSTNSRSNKTKNELGAEVPLVYGKQPQIHNYFTDEEFYRFDSEGLLINVYDQRVLRVTEDFIVAIQAGLEEEVGDAAGEIMYRCGYMWGVEDAKNFSGRFQNEFEVDFKQSRMGFLLESWWWPLQIQGWGGWRYDFSQKSQGLIFIDLYESAVARSLGLVGEVVCHFYAGLFAAVFSFLAKKTLGSIEIQCYAMGEDYCKFLISTNDRVDSAAFWRSEGASAKDIIKKIKD